MSHDDDTVTYNPNLEFEAFEYCIYAQEMAGDCFYFYCLFGVKQNSSVEPQVLHFAKDL